MYLLLSTLLSNVANQLMSLISEGESRCNIDLARKWPAFENVQTLLAAIRFLCKRNEETHLSIYIAWCVAPSLHQKTMFIKGTRAFRSSCKTSYTACGKNVLPAVRFCRAVKLTLKGLCVGAPYLYTESYRHIKNPWGLPTLVSDCSLSNACACSSEAYFNSGFCNPFKF